MKKIICILSLFQLLSFNLFSQENDGIALLRKKIYESKGMEELIQAHVDLSREYISINTDSAKHVALRGIEISKTRGNNQLLSKLYNALAIAAISSGEGSYALALMDSAITIDQQTGNRKSLAASLGNKGSVQYLLGHFGEAQKMQFEALRLYEQEGDKSAIATTWSNIHGTYYVLKDWQNAKKTGHLAYRYFMELGEKDGVAMMAYNLSCVHLEINETDSAEQYAKQCLSIFKTLGNAEGIGDGLRMLADLYSMKKQYKLARTLAEKSKNEYERIGAQHKKLQSLMNLCQIEMKAGNTNRAISLTDTALVLSRKIQSRQYTRDLLFLKMKLMAEIKNYEEYYRLSQQYLPLKDSIFNEETIESMGRAGAEYEVERHVRENENLKQKQELLELELNHKNTRIIVWSLALVLIILSVYWWYRTGELKETQRILEMREKLLQAQMSPHFVFNSLSSIQSFMYSNEPMKAARFLSSFATLMRGILDHSVSGWIYLEKECTWLEKYLEIQQLRFEDKFDYSIQIADDINPSVIKVPAMLVQPFAENSIEHGFKNIDYKGRLIIRFEIKDTNLEVVISDNGRGFLRKDDNNPGEETHAMSITRERLQILNRGRRNRIVFDIRTPAEGGTEIKFVVPMNEE